MVLSQKDQQRKKLKKQQKRKQNTQQKSSQLISWASWPIDQSRVHSGLWDAGIGTVCILRRSPSSRFVVGHYLIDVWGLGLKDAFVQEVDPTFLQHQLSQQPMQEQTPAYCKALIIAASEYSISNGFKPNWDDKSKKFIANIPFNPDDYHFEFGKDGQQFYMSGPYDREILPKMLQPA